MWRVLLAMAIGVVLDPCAATQAPNVSAGIADLLARSEQLAARETVLGICLEWSATDSRRRAIGYELLAVATDRSAALPARRLALALLGKACDEWVTPQIADLLHDPAVALDAVQALRHIPHTDPTAALAVALEWAEGDLLVAVVRALGSRRDPRSSSDVVRVMEASVDMAARRAALGALGMIEDVRTLDAVLRASDDPALHGAAITAGLKIARASSAREAPAAYSAVLRSAQSNDAIAGALTGLARAGSQADIEVIRPYTRHASSRVRVAAERAITRIRRVPDD